jgi:apolipoprotein D and lipocalin family protein
MLIRTYNRNVKPRRILRLFVGIIASALPVMVGCTYMGNEPSSPLETVSHVELDRYMGVWYEIARYPNSFQEGCVGSRATYTLMGDGKVSVLNECYAGSFSGKLRSAKGKAWVVDKRTSAKLKVSFFWFFAGDYWIIDLAEDYSYVVVGHPKRKYLWILSRTKTIENGTYEGILRRLEEVHHYDTSKIIKTLQR